MFLVYEFFIILLLVHSNINIFNFKYEMLY